MPMALASEAIVSFRESDSIADRIKHGLVVVIMVRTADTAYFIRVADLLKERNEREVFICQHCIRGSLWNTDMKRLRQEANKKIIHKMERGLPINSDDLLVVEKYYEELFKHPLTNPISWPTVTGMQRCQYCRKKHQDQLGM